MLTDLSLPIRVYVGKMSDRAWMYTGHTSQKDMTYEWFTKTKEFVRPHLQMARRKPGAPVSCAAIGKRG